MGVYFRFSKRKKRIEAKGGSHLFKLFKKKKNSSIIEIVLLSGILCETQYKNQLVGGKEKEEKEGIFFRGKQRKKEERRRRIFFFFDPTPEADGFLYGFCIEKKN